MNVDQKKKFLVNFAYLAVILLIAYFVFKYCIGLIMPFFIAFIIVSILRPLINLLVRKCHFKNSIAAPLVMAVFYCTIGVLLALAGVKIFAALKDQFMQLPSFYTDTVEPVLQEVYANLKDFAGRLDASLVSALSDTFPKIIESISNAVSSLSVKAVGGITSFASSLPTWLIAVAICIISSFFIATDYSVLVSFVEKQLPEKTLHLWVEIRKYFVDIVGKYIRSYGIIMCITFCELLIGLLILRVPRAPLIALGIAIFDILPVFGVGGIVIPWAAIALLSGDYKMTIGLLILYVIILVVRNIIEPKIVGNQVGLHPVVTLMAMFVGSALFGVIGLFGLPISLAVLKGMNDNGVIHILK